MRGEPNFGTYHHSRPGGSKKIRGAIRAMFTEAFSSLPFGRHDKLKILDMGCGLGFLSCVSAEFYANARITGVDTFEHASLRGSSLERAEANAKILGLSDRIDFTVGDVLKFTPVEKFDIFVSNLVFHNLGRTRFKAYSRLSSWAQAGSFVLIGDLFFSRKVDLTRLSKEFRILREMKPNNGFTEYSLLVMAKNPA